MYRWNLKSRAKLTTYEVNKPALSHVAMVTGAKPQAEYGFLCGDIYIYDDDEQGAVKESHQWRRLISEESAAALIDLRHYSSNTLVLVI